MIETITNIIVRIKIVYNTVILMEPLMLKVFSKFFMVFSGVGIIGDGVGVVESLIVGVSTGLTSALGEALPIHDDRKYEPRIAIVRNLRK